MLRALVGPALLADTLYVANNSSASIEKFTAAGVGSVFASSGVSGPAFLALSPGALLPKPTTLSIQPVPGQPAQARLLFGPILGGYTYSVQTKTDLTAAAWSALTGTSQSDVGGTRTLTDPNATGAAKFGNAK